MRRAAFLLTLAVLAVAGCIRPQITPTAYYTLAPNISVEKAVPTERTLGVRPLRASLMYKTPLLYTQGLEVREYPHAEWAMKPADMVTRAITDAIIATERFHDVGEASNVNRPELVLVGELRKFETDHNAVPREAVCEVRLELRETFGTRLLWGDVLTARVPLENEHISAVPQAMSRAVAEVANRAAAEVAKN
ncbi:MAG TPA: ABC-type transport auxiliary lipoprotein family protein [Candidatus Hydrogenedentes bacterium]|nr:ABC-type transport auxiliary lipoprotein family protein [Candidatus Hydrogenedentota bacterium]